MIRYNIRSRALRTAHSNRERPVDRAHNGVDAVVADYHSASQFLWTRGSEQKHSGNNEGGGRILTVRRAHTHGTNRLLWIMIIPEKEMGAILVERGSPH